MNDTPDNPTTAILMTDKPDNPPTADMLYKAWLEKYRRSCEFTFPAPLQIARRAVLKLSDKELNEFSEWLKNYYIAAGMVPCKDETDTP